MELEQEFKLQDWHAAVTAAIEAKKVIEKELALRKEIMPLFFPAPQEGTNSLELGAGWTLKATHKIDRKIDAAALPAVFHQLREMGVNPDPLVRVVPALETKAYKALSQVNPDAARVFDQALTIKPASPTLELIPPKAE